MIKFKKKLALFIFISFFIAGFSGTAMAATTVDLGTAGYFAILAGSGITNTGPSVINGSLGVSPGTSLTGFLPGVFTGTQHVADATAAQAKNDLTTAYNSAAGKACDHNLTGQDLGGMTLDPGVYCFDTSAQLTGILTLDAQSDPEAVFIFKIASTLTTAPGSSVVFVNNTQSCKVFWQVGSSATLGTTTSFKGNVLALASITLNTGATIEGKLLASTGAVTLDTNTLTETTCASSSSEGTINVIKVVINDNDGTKSIADFPLFVNSTPVVSGVTNSFSASASAYTISETADPNYIKTFSGDCDANGQLTLSSGDSKFCIITNDDIAPNRGTRGLVYTTVTVDSPVTPPLIDVLKVPSPLALPLGPGLVNYTYTVSNIGTVPVTDITMVGDSCSPVTYVSGDTNNDSKLDTNEAWIYRCATTLSETHTNTVVATGWANGLSASDVASATVIVGLPIVPPLIHVTKIPSVLSLIAGGGIVTYTEKITNPGTVALNNVSLIDDKCSPVRYVSGDINNDLKLDTNETWIYTCETKLTKTTTNTAIARGEANGLTVRDIAIATVVVALPSLPQTGVIDNSWFIGIMVGAIILISVLFVVFRKKNQAS